MALKPLAILIVTLLVFRLPLAGQEIGLQLESFRHEFASDPPGAMKKVKDLGFSQVEMANTYGLTFPQFIKLLAVNDLSVVSFETTYDRLTQFPNDVIAEARSYGAKYIVCSPGNSRVASELGVEKTAGVLNQAGKLVAQNGLLLCYKPDQLDFLLLSSSTYFDLLVHHLQTGIVYLAMDVYAIKQAGKEPVALLRKYPTRFVLMYLKDRKRSNDHVEADKESTVALGSGDVGISEVMRAARELGIQHFFINDSSTHAEQHISEGLAYLKTINDQSRK